MRSPSTMRVVTSAPSNSAVGSGLPVVAQPASMQTTSAMTRRMAVLLFPLFQHTRLRVGVECRCLNQGHDWRERLHPFREQVRSLRVESAAMKRLVLIDGSSYLYRA